MVLQWPSCRLYIPVVKEVLTMFVNIDITVSRYSSSSVVGIGSSVHYLGKQFLIKDYSDSAVIGLNDVRVEPRKNAS